MIDWCLTPTLTVFQLYRDIISFVCHNIKLSMCDVSVFDIYFTEFGAALTTVLPVLFKYCYKYCYSDSRKL